MSRARGCVGGLGCYEWLVMVTCGGVIEKVFYPVACPRRAAAQVIAWLGVTGW